MEYEFIIVYKLGCTHVVVDTLSRLMDTIESIRVLFKPQMLHCSCYNQYG
jgi:hypothetical protein